MTENAHLVTLILGSTPKLSGAVEGSEGSIKFFFAPNFTRLFRLEGFVIRDFG